MSEAKISVIVPVYNMEKYLEKCLNSLINQTLTDIEIICVNDGSTDSSLKILEEFAQADSRIKILTQQNSGQSVARNYGISNATGEYLGFVDSDDWVDLDYFEKLYNAAKDNNCDIACAGFKRCGKVLSSVRKSYKEKKVYKDINDKVVADNLPNDNYLWNKIFKREKWNFKLAEGRFFEDMALVIQILYFLGDMTTVPQTYYHYRRSPNSTITRKDTKHDRDYEWAEQELYSFAEQHEIILPKNKNFNKKEILKFCGLTILKIYHYDNVIKYKLFGFIPILNKHVGCGKTQKLTNF